MFVLERKRKIFYNLTIRLVFIMINKKSLLLSLLSIGLVLSSCGKSEKPSETTDDSGSTNTQLQYEVLSAWTPKVTITYDENLHHEFNDIKPLSDIDQERLASTLFDVPRNSTLKIHFNESAPEYYTCENVVNNNGMFLSVKDAVSNKFHTSLPLSTDGDKVSLEFDETFEYGKVYRISLNPGAHLQFENKDPSIQTLVIEMEDDPSEEAEYNTCIPKENVPTLDINNVSSEQTEENNLLSFVYSGTVPTLQKGDLFYVKSQANDRFSMADFYGIYQSQEQVNDKTKVYYSEPKGEDMYEDLRVKGVKPVDLSGLQLTATKEYIQDQFKYSDSARALLSLFSKQAETTDVKQLGSIMDHIELSLTFNYYNNVLNLTFSIGAKDIKLRDNLFLTVVYTYNLVNNYSTDYDISLKTAWGVPVGIDYKVKCIQDSTESHTFMASVKYQKEQVPAGEDEQEEDVKNDLIRELQAAKGSKDNFFKKIKDSADAVAETEGNKTTIPIFKLPIELPGALIFEIRLEISFDFTIQAMLFVRRQIKSQDVVFNFASEGGGDTSEKKRIEGGSTWDVYFMGLVEFKLSLKLALALYFVGTYKYLHVEAYGELWLKVGLQGSLLASFDTDTDGSAFSGNLSIDFYVMFGVDVGLDIVVAFWHENISFTLFKAYIFRIYMCNEVEHYADNTVTHIDMVNTTKDNINNYDILNFTVWDGVYMIMNEKKFNADDRQSIITLFDQEILGVNMFTFTPEDESLLKISQDGEITIPDGTPAEFTTHFTIHLHNAISFVQDREIEVYFNAPDAHHLYYQDNVDGTDKGEPVDAGRYRPTYKYKLPDAPEKAGYKFLSYEVNGETKKPGDEISMPETDLTIKIKWHKLEYYQVQFLDGKGNIVYVDSHVEEYTAAKEPPELIRDQYMEGYKFIGWDKNISSVTTNMIVRGIYVKVGE